MTITIKIHTDNAAFEDREAEIARILARVCREFYGFGSTPNTAPRFKWQYRRLCDREGEVMSKRYLVRTVCTSTTYEVWTVTVDHDEIPDDNELLDIINDGDASFEEQNTEHERDREVTTVQLART